MSEQDSEPDETADDTEDLQPTETLQIHYVLNNTLHDEDDSIHDEDESSEEEHVTEIETYFVNGEQNNIQGNKLLTTNLEVKVVTAKSKSSYATQQIDNYSNSS